MYGILSTQYHQHKDLEREKCCSAVSQQNSKSVNVVVKATLTTDKFIQIVNLILKSLLKLINACYSSIVRQRILKFSDSLLCNRNSLFDAFNVISLKLVGKILQVVSCRQSVNLILQIVNLLLIVSVSNLLFEILKSFLLSFEILLTASLAIVAMSRLSRASTLPFKSLTVF